MAEKEPRLSKISKMHYGKLVLRGSVFLAALAVYVPNRLRGAEGLYETFAGFTGLIPFVWIVFMADMICRMFPAKFQGGAQGIYSAITVGLGGLVGSAVGGVVLDAFNYTVLYTAFSGVALLGLVICLLFVPKQ